jgi:hypothetical protein
MGMDQPLEVLGIGAEQREKDVFAFIDSSKVEDLLFYQVM